MIRAGTCNEYALKPTHASKNGAGHRAANDGKTHEEVRMGDAGERRREVVQSNGWYDVWLASKVEDPRLRVHVHDVVYALAALDKSSLGWVRPLCYGLCEFSVDHSRHRFIVSVL